jgi:hypothetical protein
MCYQVRVMRSPIHFGGRDDRIVEIRLRPLFFRARRGAFGSDRQRGDEVASGLNVVIGGRLTLRRLIRSRPGRGESSCLRPSSVGQFPARRVRAEQDCFHAAGSTLCRNVSCQTLIATRRESCTPSVKPAPLTNGHSEKYMRERTRYALCITTRAGQFRISAR